MENMYIYIYDKDHTKLAEIYDLTEIEYTHTLNGICSATIKIPSNSPKNTDENKQEYNHIEIYKVIDGIDKLLWWGVLANWTPDGVNIELSCLGYFYLLNKRIYREDKTYSARKYNVLAKNMLEYVNAISDTGITIGESQESSSSTERKLSEGDDIWTKLQEYLSDSNTYARIDKDRKLNYYNEKYGTDKSDYYEVNKFNLISTNSMNRDSTSLYNYILGSSKYTENNEEKTITCVKLNEESISRYGLLEYYLDLNDITKQSTLEERVQEYLDKHSIPNVNMELEVINCDTLNIYDLDVGDYIHLGLNDLYGIDTNIRVIEITVNSKNETAKLTLGNVLYREVSPNRRLYIGS